jgi:RHS repeat-associated protein
VAARQLYAAWGAVRWSAGTLPTDFTFTGQREDSYLDIVAMGARWYLPRIGRWLSPDTIVPDPANPQSLNRFAYVGNNPLRFVDPAGHQSSPPPLPPSACDRSPGLSGCEWYSRLPAEPLPPSYVQIVTHYHRSAERHRGRSVETAGVVMSPNVILSHGHFLAGGETPDDIKSITVGGRLFYPGEGEDYLYVTFHGNLSLFVFRYDIFSPDQVAPLGDADDLETGMIAQQSVYRGVPRQSRGLYHTGIVATDLAWVDRGITHRHFQVSPDLTITGDSGSPLYIDGVVYGVNNRGEGYYSAVTDIPLIQSLIMDMEEKLEQSAPWQ